VQVGLTGAVRVGRMRAICIPAHVHCILNPVLLRTAEICSCCAAQHLIWIMRITTTYGLRLWIRICVRGAVHETVSLRLARRLRDDRTFVTVVAVIHDRTVWKRRCVATNRAFIATLLPATNLVKVIAARNTNVGFQAIRRRIEAHIEMHIIHARRVPKLRDVAALFTRFTLVLSIWIAIIGAIDEAIDANVVLFAVGSLATKLKPFAFHG
jgi:hypothetical protein